MSKKRLYKKNIKTKKKIKGGFDGIAAVASAAAAVDSTKKLGDELGGVVNKIDGVSDKLSNKVGDVDNAINSLNAAGDNAINSAVGATRDNAIGALNAAGDNAINSAVGAVGATALGATALGAVANNPFAKFGKGALNAVDKLKKGLQFIKGSLTPEDKYRHALLKLRKNPGFKNYFATAVNKVIVFNFYNVLIELGKYSRNYSDISKEIFEITGENMFDEDNDLYSELNEESSVSEGSEESEETDCVQDADEDRIISDNNIEKFLNDTIILCIPSIKENFKSLENIIEDYKKLKGKMNGLLEKSERENNVEKYFDDVRILSDEAIEQINTIFNDFDTSKMSGGKMSGGKEIDNIEDDFYDALLKMSIGNRDNFSKLLKQKLHGILNKIIKQLYDIANCKKIIDANNEYDDNEYDMKFLEKTVKTTDFNIEEFENRISERIGDLKKKQESLTEKQTDFDKKAEENYDNLKKKSEENYNNFKEKVKSPLKIFRIGDATKKDDTASDATKKDDTASDATSDAIKKDDTASDAIKKDDNTTTQNGGAKLFLPEALREEANAVSDSLSMVESQREIQEENLEIVKYQKILIVIIKKMICKIQKNSDIDLEPFKNIVKPAFIEKKMQFRNFVKIWSKDFHEKQDLLNEVLNKGSKDYFEEVLETREYMKKIKMQIDIAVKNQKEIKEYIKTKEEKQKEIDDAKAAEEAKIKAAEAEAKKAAEAEAKKTAEEVKKKAAEEAKAKAKLKADADAKLKADAEAQAKEIRKSAEETKIKNKLEQEEIKKREKENIERLNKEQKDIKTKIDEGVQRVKAEQKENARTRKRLDKQKDIYAKQGRKTRERLDKDIQEKANSEIKKKQQEIENELKKNNEKIKAEAEEAAKMIKAEAEKAKKAKEQLQNEINKTNNEKIKAESEEAAKMIKASEEAKKAKEQLKNEINKTNNDYIKKSNEEQKNIEILNKKRIQDIQAKNQEEAKANKLDPFAGGRTTRKFSSPVSRKTRRRKQTFR